MIEIITHKRCTLCKEVKPINCFGPDGGSKDGYRHACRLCRNAQGRASYAKRAVKRPKRVRSIYTPVPTMKDHERDECRNFTRAMRAIPVEPRSFL